jgi:predicted NBD/HSP70 family sugar kinase
MNTNKISDSAAMPRDLKLINRAKIISYLKDCGVTTVNEIAKATGISRQTTIKSVEDFVHMGLVLSLGKGSSTKSGGKKPELFRFNETYRFNICVRFENHTVITALTDLHSNSLCIKTAEHKPNEKLEVILKDIERLYKEILVEQNITKEQIYGFGVCMGGICDSQTGIMRYNSLYPAWGQDIPIVDMLRSFVPESIHILVANDSKMTGIAELCYDESLAEKRVVTLYSLDGISACYINKGKIDLGDHSLLGEIGHLTVDITDDELCQCGSKGCFERLVSSERLYKMITADKRYNSSLLIGYGNNIKMKDYFACVKQGDELAKTAVEYAAGYFAVALRSIMLMLDPELIIIQGKYAYAGDFFKAKIKEKMVSFKYYPEKEIEIVYDKREIRELAILGLSHTLNNRFFSNI